ncbi:MAG TPA: hypothetical protein VLW54_14445 [Candidatus Acidoferrales bacterium]|nr:hypothetical protein [Candidatus Acidoferrales bacterium]
MTTKSATPTQGATVNPKAATPPGNATPDNGGARPPARTAAGNGGAAATAGKPVAPAAGKADASPQRWIEAQLVFPVYRAMAEQFNLSGPPCRMEDLCGQERCEEMLRAARTWFDEMDEQTPVNKVRQLLQANYAAAEKNLRAFAIRLLRKPAKKQSDRDKVDFLMVQYFAASAPQHVATRDVSYADTALVLRPILGQVSPISPESLAPLENILDAAREAGSLAELLHSKLLETGRQIKDALGEAFYQAESLVAFCRFNYLLRRSFIRLSHADLRVTRDALCQLEGCSVHRIDCRAAGLSATEPVAELHRICSDWKHPFRAEFSEYSIPTTLERLIGLRAAAEAALAGIAKKTAEPGAAEPPAAERESDGEPGGDLAVELNRGPRAAHPEPARRAGAPSRPAFRSVLAMAEPQVKLPPRVQVRAAEPQEKTGPPTFRVAEAGVHEEKRVPPPPAPIAQAEEPAPKAAGIAAAALEMTPLEPQEITETEVENCSEKVWEQLISAPRDRGRSMSTIQLDGVKLLLSSWEVAAFVSDGGPTAKDIRRAVVVRALLAAALENHVTKGNRARLASALALSANEMNRLQGAVEKAKSAKQTEGAVNLAMTAKRLLAFVEQAGDLRV